MATIGDRLAELRTRRALTQEELAEQSGVSVAVIRKLEQNDRTSARMVTLHRLASALDVTTSDLLRPAPSLAGPPSEPDTLAVLALRQALTPIRSIPGALAQDGPAEPASPADVRASLSTALDLYQDSRLSATVTALTALLADLRRIEPASGQQAEVLGLNAEAHQLAASVLAQLRLFDLAYLAIDRAMDDAEAAGDPLLGAAIASTLTFLLLRQGRIEEALQVAVRTADAIEPKLSTATPAHAAVWGRLLILGSGAAVRNNQHDQADEMLLLARAAASRVPATDFALASPASFGRERVSMQDVENQVMAGHPDKALRLADRIPSVDMDQASHHLLDVASAQTDLRRYTDATDTLMRVYDAVPEWLRYQPYASETVCRLLGARKRTLSRDLRTLADFLAVETCS